MTSRDHIYEVNDKTGELHLKVNFSDIRHIFRTVAPMIIRQWKDVCRELDVPEEELYEIERGKPWERLSEMAYQGLCVWLDREGKAATKAKLIKALRRCELKRAEEAVEGITVRKAERQSKDQRPRKMSPMKSRKSVSSDQSSGKEIVRPAMQSRSAGRRYSHASTDKRDKWKIESDEVAVEVTASEVMTEQPVSGNWKDTYQKMVLHFYTSVVRSEDDHKKALTTLMDFRDVFVKRIMLGSLVVVLGCKSLRGLEKLHQNYMGGQVEQLFQTALVTKSILDDMGLTDIFLEVYIDPSYFERCRETLLSRKLSRSSLKSSKSSRSRSRHQDSEEEVNWSEVLEVLEKEIASVKQQCRQFQENWKDIIQGIKRVRTETKVTSFRDVMDCYSRIKCITDVETGSVDLFKEYCGMVDSISQKTEELTHKLKKHKQVNSALERSVSDLELMLHPDFPFKEDAQFVFVSLSGAEKRSMVGLLAYIPQLLVGLDKVVLSIKSSITSL